MADAARCARALTAPFVRAQELRKVCNHPLLIQGSEETVMAGVHDNRAYLEAFVNASGKFVLLDKLLPKLKAENHKVLIFSQFVQTLDLLESYMRMRGFGMERIDGCVKGSDRERAIQRFCRTDSPSFVFLLSTRAGGVGINLTAADTVVRARVLALVLSCCAPGRSPDAPRRLSSTVTGTRRTTFRRRPAATASDRRRCVALIRTCLWRRLCADCGRVAQEVQVYRLVTRKSYETVMLDRASRKLGLEQAVLGNITGTETARAVRAAIRAAALRVPCALTRCVVSQGREAARPTMDPKEIEALLRRGAYDVFKDVRGTRSCARVC